MNVLFAIPMSLLGTIAILYFCGFTLNTFTLLGLSLAVGLVVDDAVMVMENIFRHAEMGKDRMTAAGEGTKEITFAALAATIAVIAIFLPVAFMSGVIGKFFLQFGVTLSVAVALSYFEAITLAPARCAQMLRTTSHEQRGLRRSAADRGFDGALARVLLGARALAPAARGSCSASRSRVLAARRLVATQHPAGVRAVAGPEPPQRAPHDGGRARTSTATDALVRRAEQFLVKRPEVVDVMSTTVERRTAPSST